LDEDKLRANLHQFTGSTTCYQHVTRALIYTEGVRFLAQNGRLYWLIDIIASWQLHALKDPALAEFQLWELRIANDRTAAVICLRDCDDEAFRQELPFADSALDYVKLYVEDGMLMLPSEH
jgi:hypothetical protein